MLATVLRIDRRGTRRKSGDQLEGYCGDLAGDGGGGLFVVVAVGGKKSDP